MAQSTTSIIPPAAVKLASSANSLGLTCLGQHGRLFFLRETRVGQK